jgi:hypothetical protein
VVALVEKRTGERPVAGFNLLAVTGGRGICMHWDGRLRATEFGGGAHVISSNYDLDDPAMPELGVFDAWRRQGPVTEARLGEFLASHDGPRPVCKHPEANGGDYGTVSSSLYVESARRLLHADGPPCRSPWVDHSRLLAQG